MSTGTKEEKEKTHPLKTAWNIITWVLIGAVIVMAMGLVGIRIFGLRPFAVLSGSMEPTYKTGSIVYVKKVDYHDLTLGDPITFMLDEETVATHRIVEVLPDPDDPEVIRYRTKGDANEAVDGGLVHYLNVLGKPVFTIPYLGYVSNYIQHPPGTYIVIAACAILILLAFLPDLLDDEKDEVKKKKKPCDEEKQENNK